MQFDLEGMDTKTLAEQGVWLDLVMVDGVTPLMANGQRVRIKLAGTDSEAYRAVIRAQTAARLQRMDRQAAIADLENEALDLLAACTLAWEGITANGQPVSVTRASARALYGAFPAIRDQVDAFVGRRGNFVKASPTISSIGHEVSSEA